MVFSNAPLFPELQAWFQAYASFDIVALLCLVTSDFRTVQVSWDDQSLTFDDTTTWETYMRGYFEVMVSMGSTLQVDILDYQGDVSDHLGYSVVRYCRHLTMGADILHQTCRALVVWQMTDSGWKSKHWHCTAEYHTLEQYPKYHN